MGGGSTVPARGAGRLPGQETHARGGHRHRPASGAAGKGPCFSCGLEASTGLLTWAVAGQLAARAAWRHVASLRHHASPVLSTACMPRPGPGPGGGGPLAFSGGTDGGVALWDLAAVTAGYVAAWAAGGAEGWAPVEVGPAAVLAGVHQSGVNGLAACTLEGRNLAFVQRVTSERRWHRIAWGVMMSRKAALTSP